MAEIGLSPRGLELEAPQPGDIVTVLIRPPSTKAMATAEGWRPRLSLFGGLGFESEWAEHENPQHYRVTRIWRVVAVNGAQAVVQALTGYDAWKGKRETWPIARHRWFDATELWRAMRRTQVRENRERREREAEMKKLCEGIRDA